MPNLPGMVALRSWGFHGQSASIETGDLWRHHSTKAMVDVIFFFQYDPILFECGRISVIKLNLSDFFITGGAAMVNDELPYKILTGQVQCKPKCISISGNTVRFSDGTSVSDVNVIACATGFDINFSFIQDEQIKSK